MTIKIFVLKGNLNSENRSGAFLFFVPGIVHTNVPYSASNHDWSNTYTSLDKMADTTTSTRHENKYLKLHTLQL